MSKLLKLAGSIFLVLMFCLSFTADSVVSAASDKTTQDSMKTDKEAKKARRLFRDSVIATANDSTQIIRQFFIFITPPLESELEFYGKVEGQSFNAAGNFGFWLTDNDGNLTEKEIPFYLRQEGKDMMLYYKNGENWKKFSTPTVAATLTDMVASPTREELDKQVKLIEKVTILEDNDKRRTLLVNLDSEKIADEMKMMATKNPADKGTADDEAFQNSVLQCIDEGLRNSNLWYIWTIDKVNNRTVAISFDLSSAVQEIAREALRKIGDTPVDDSVKEILERLAFYSEFKAYTTLMNPSAASRLVIPQEVLDAARETEDVIPDGVGTSEKTEDVTANEEVVRADYVEPEETADAN